MFLLVAISIVSGQSPGPSPSGDRESLYVATAPSSSLKVQTLAAPIFPRIPGSFTNAARNAAIDWNVATQWVVREANVTNMGGRVFALQSVGVWHALQANSKASPPANSTAVVAYAAHLLLMDLFPRFYSQYDQLLRKQTSGLTADQLAYAKAIAHPAATKWLASRLDDGSQGLGSIIPRTAPDGYFQNITTNAKYRTFTQYASSSPMCLSANQSEDILEEFPPSVPYPSDQFNTQYTASYLLGGLTSTLRTTSQTVTAIFWADAGTGLVAHWNQVALSTLPKNTTVESTSKLLALLNIAIYDSICVSYALKFKFDVWRPILAIRKGDSEHAPDLTWTSFLPTPNNPSYPSSLSGLAGVAETVFQSFYGTDDYTFLIGSEYGLGNNTLPARVYTSFSSAAEEVVESRYLAGTEFKVDSTAGRSLGQQVAALCIPQFADI